MRPDRVPGGAELDGDHPRRRVGQQLTVVADEQDRLLRAADPALQPDLPGHVEEVVRLVEEEHLVGTREEVLQHQPLLLATAERLEVAVLRLVETDPQRRGAAGVPDDLDLVAPGVGELGERRGVRHLGGLVVGLHQRQLEPVHLGSSGPHTGRRDGQQQLRHRRRVATDHLAHHPEPTRPGHRALVRHQLAGDDPQQRRLAGAVGTHQGDLGALAHPEGDVVEQDAPVRQLVAHPGNLHVSHAGDCPCRAQSRHLD